MRRLLSLTTLLLAAVAPAAFAQAPDRPYVQPGGEPSTAAPKASAVVVPPLPFRTRTLANGLRVFSAVDRTTPNVTVQVFYDVGGKDDPQHRSGFAHLFEHMMFKATRDMPSEYMDRLTEDVGGFNNASTADDVTSYFEVIPANHLERLLWAEAERMSSLKVDQSAFTSERAVVEEELRQRVLADPYGRLQSLLVPEASFRVHPYKRPVIGSIEDLDQATLADVQAFHATYYRPDNANLVVIGDFDPATLDAWVDHYFSAIGHPAAPIPRVTAVEPARTAPSEVTGYGPNVPLPAIALSFLAPAGSSGDGAALAVVDAILTTGHSSRLYRDLVYQQQIAQDVFSSADLRQQPWAVPGRADHGRRQDAGPRRGGAPSRAGAVARPARHARGTGPGQEPADRSNLARARDGGGPRRRTRPRDRHRRRSPAHQYGHLRSPGGQRRRRAAGGPTVLGRPGSGGDPLPPRGLPAAGRRHPLAEPAVRGRRSGRAECRPKRSGARKPGAHAACARSDRQFRPAAPCEPAAGQRAEGDRRAHLGPADRDGRAGGAQRLDLRSRRHGRIAEPHRLAADARRRGPQRAGDRLGHRGAGRFAGERRRDRRFPDRADGAGRPA